MPSPAALHVEQELLPEGLIITLKGEITASAEEIFSEFLKLEPWPHAILLDFCAVEYINSAGIALLIMLLRQANTKGGVIRARGLSEHYHKIFRMVGLTQYVEVLF